MKRGNPQIDREAAKFVKAMLATGNWAVIPGRKHTKLQLKVNGRVMVVAGSSGDVRARKNLVCGVHRMEREAGLQLTAA